MENFGYYLFIGLTAAVIFSQVPHVYHAFTMNSQLRNDKLKIFQGVIFCGILSVAIFAFVWIERPWLAFAGAAVEAIINIYYFTMDFWEEGWPVNWTVNAKEKKRNSIKTFWRKRWFKIFIAILIPSLIFGFSEILVNMF